MVALPVKCPSRLPWLTLAACSLLWSTPAVAQSPSPSPTPSGNPFDADGDGLEDEFDPYPCDANAGAVIYVPSEGEAGTIFFEDQWPKAGDLDFNDVVVSFNYAFYLTSDGISSIRATFNVAALGGRYDNGLALRLPVPGASSVVRRIGSGDPQPAEVIADGERDMIIRVSPNLRELFGNQPDRINSLTTMPRQSGQTVEVTITFSEPVQLFGGEVPFDLFIFRAEDPSHEIHLPRYDGTQLMNRDLFRTADDNTNFEGTWFVDQQGLPFALMVPASVPYPAEGAAISQLYPDIVEFGGSGGLEGNNFYQSNMVEAFAYRDVNGLGPITPAQLPPPSTDRCCISDGDNYSVEPNGEIFPYDDLSGGTALLMDEDEVSAPLPLGFTFAFDGQSFNSVHVSSNGFLSFLGDSDGCCQGQGPGYESLRGVIAGFWEDLSPPSGGTIRYQTLGEGSTQRFVVEFADVPHFGLEGGWENMPSVISNGVNTVSFQMVLFANGEIELRLLDTATDGGTHFVGVTGLRGNNGLVVAHGDNFAFYQQAFRISPFNSSSSPTGGPYQVDEYSEITLDAGCMGGQVITWDFDDDGEFDDGEGPSPTFSAIGYDGPASHPVTMRSCDMSGACETYPSVIEVVNVNPYISTSPDDYAVAGTVYEYQPSAEDPAGEADPITWSLVDGPEGMTVDPSTGLLTWQVPYETSDQWITIGAHDGDGTSLQSWNLDIGAPPPVEVPEFGPDAFGYTYADTAFSFEDISESGARIYLGDDQVSAALDMGFDFSFYGVAHQQIGVSSNGFVTFGVGQSDGCCSGVRAGSSGNPSQFIAGYWEDLNPTYGGSITYQTLGEPGAQRFIVQFTDVQHYGRGNPATFQIVLFEADGAFEIRHLSSRTDGGDHSVGFQGPGGAGGLSIRYGSYTLTETAWRATAP